MTLILEQSVFAAKQEAAAGTPETLTSAEGAYNAFNVAVVDNTEIHERNGQSSLDPIPAVSGKRPGTLTFESELVGNGASGLPNWATVLLPCCGLIATGATYKPITADTNHKTATMGKFEGGRLRYIAGAMGRLSMRLTVGMPGMINWEFNGRYGVEEDETLIAPTYPTTMPPVFESGTFTVGGTAYLIRELTINIENTIYVREDPAADGGLRNAVITNRRIAINIDPEASLIASKDWQADLLAHNLAALNCVLNGGANNTITLNCPKVQVIRKSTSDREGLLVDPLELIATRNTAAGDDAFSIAFS